MILSYPTQYHFLTLSLDSKHNHDQDCFFNLCCTEKLYKQRILVCKALPRTQPAPTVYTSTTITTNRMCFFDVDSDSLPSVRIVEKPPPLYTTTTTRRSRVSYPRRPCCDNYHHHDHHRHYRHYYHSHGRGHSHGHERRDWHAHRDSRVSSSSSSSSSTSSSDNDPIVVYYLRP